MEIYFFENKNKCSLDSIQVKCGRIRLRVRLNEQLFGDFITCDSVPYDDLCYTILPGDSMYMLTYVSVDLRQYLGILSAWMNLMCCNTHLNKILYYISVVSVGVIMIDHSQFKFCLTELLLPNLVIYYKHGWLAIMLVQLCQCNQR